MIEALYIIIGVAVGFAIGYLLVSGKKTALLAQINMLEEQLKKSVEDAEKALSRQEAKHLAEVQRLNEHHEKQIANQQEQHEKQLANQQEQHEKNLAAFREQLENDTRKLLQQRQEELQRGNTIQMDAILNPFKDKLAEMKKAFEENKESNHRNSASFAEQMKALMERSQQLGTDAQNLTEALKNKGKVQGDWGEQVLETILQNSGLREGEEYEIQENVKDDEGNNLRPDVIVHCSDGRQVIIDSKVSLTGFYNYISSTTDEERQKAERDNLDSVRRHVKELVDKDYAKLVQNAVPTVLMFIPNEGSYILALQKDPNIANEAFRKGVLIINPTNLMLALHLIVQLWQYDRKEENDRKIVETATAMYEKFCIFAETFEKVGSQLQTVNKSYDQARTQLTKGKGNLLKRLDTLQNMGVTTTKQIPHTLKE